LPPQGPPTRPAPSSAAPPIIDAIAVEKDEVCEGEENLVTVRAHTSDGTDEFLHYRVGPASGAAVPLRSYLDDRGRPSAHRVSVFGKNNAVTTVEVPPYRVKPCDAAVVVIEHRLEPNTGAVFDFYARIVSTGADAGLAASFRPRAFRWSFGDGTREEGREPNATHSYADRAQDTLYSQFLVTVEVLEEDGRVLRGRHSLELLNPAFEALAYKGVVLLFADLDPRFPVLSPGGVVEQRVRLWHARPTAVTVTKVAVTTRYTGAAGRSAPTYPAVGSVLGATQIPPGRGIELRAALDTRLEPEAISRDYTLEGRTYDGHVARGAFSVMKPPSPPSKAHHDPISDPLLTAKVQIARDVLHREYVTDEDLWALERAGKFAGIAGDGGTQSRVAAPSERRPPTR
jgi:hypothetical protein